MILAVCMEVGIQKSYIRSPCHLGWGRRLLRRATHIGAKYFIDGNKKVFSSIMKKYFCCQILIFKMLCQKYSNADLTDGLGGIEAWRPIFIIPEFFYAFSKRTYRIVASTNTCYYSENQLYVQRSQYIRTENPLHKQSEKAKTCH